MPTAVFDIDLLAKISRLNGDEGTTPLSDEELVGLRDEVMAILNDVDTSKPTADDLKVVTEGVEIVTACGAEMDRRLSALTASFRLPTPEPPAEEAPTEPTKPTLPSISQLAHRAPTRVRPVPTATEHGWRQGVRPRVATVLTADGFPNPERSVGELVAAAVVRQQRLSAPDGEVILATMHAEYPDDRRLDDSLSRNEEKILAACDTDKALVASGGICGPVAADYTLATIASSDRPVRDALTQFGAARGGIRYIPPHTLDQVHADGGASLWTQATDANPGNSTKSIATYTCQTPTEAYVDAVVQQIKLGNFQSRYFPEQVDQYLATSDADHARLAESTLLGQMLTGSKLVPGALNQLGLASDYMAHIDLAVARYRYSHRMAADSMLQVLYPEWLEDAMRADLARELPGNSGGQSERLAVADAQIDNFFRVRNLAPVGYLDNPTGANPSQGWVTQGVGPILPWPTKVLSFIFHPGCWLYLDGGELNLGMVRDSTNNATNTFTMFREVFEKAILKGHESIALMLDVCPSGARQAVLDASAAICASGS